AVRRLLPADPFDDRLEVGGGGAAAPADDVRAVLGDEPVEPLGEPRGVEREVRLVAAGDREAGVREYAQQPAAVAAEVAGVVRHQVRADPAVHAEYVDLVDRVEGDQAGRDVGPRQHLLVLV